MIRVYKHWLPVVIWMGVISFLSTDAGSAEHSSRILEPLLRWIKPTTSPEEFALVHQLLRKAAHLSEYAVLCLLTFRAIRLSRSAANRRWSAWAVGLMALVVACAYSFTDEFHQSLVPGRTAALGDVMIDCCGAVLGLSLVGMKALLSGLREDKPAARPTVPQN